MQFLTAREDQTRRVCNDAAGFDIRYRYSSDHFVDVNKMILLGILPMLEKWLRLERTGKRGDDQRMLRKTDKRIRSRHPITPHLRSVQVSASYPLVMGWNVPN